MNEIRVQHTDKLPSARLRKQARDIHNRFLFRFTFSSLRYDPSMGEVRVLVKLANVADIAFAAAGKLDPSAVRTVEADGLVGFGHAYPSRCWTAWDSNLWDT